MSAKKPFPLPGHVWRWDGNDVAPASGPHVVIGLRWLDGRAEALFYSGSCTGIEHMMTLDAWVLIPMADA